MATYNRAHFIVETLLSIQQQTFKEWECLIIDDGGNDNTQEVIIDLLKNDIRFQFFKRPDSYIKGLSGSRNYGLDLAQGDYVLFFDDDDFVHPQNLKIAIEEIRTNKVDFCHFQKKAYQIEVPVITEALVTTVKLLTKNDIAKIITQEIGMASCTVLWNRRCFTEIRFNECLLYAEEWECYSKIISEGFKGVVIDTVLYYNRKHAESNTGEFYRNSLIRKKSYVDAVLLVFSNLYVNSLLDSKLIHYFVQLSLSYKEYEMFSQLIAIAQFSPLENIKWKFFYFSLPIRLFCYRYWKQIKKKYF